MYVEADKVADKARLFKSLNYDIQRADIVWMPLPEGQQQLERSSERANMIHKLMDDLEAEEDVTGVYSNTTFEA